MSHALRSLTDLGTVAWFELLRAGRSWRAMALVTLLTAVQVGGMYATVRVLKIAEKEAAALLGVRAPDKPGTLIAEALQSDQVRGFIGELVDVSLLDAFGPFSLVFFAFAFVAVPFTAASFGAEAISLDLASRSIRFEALRTGRTELVVGRFAGQSLLMAAALAVASLVSFLAVSLWTVDVAGPSLLVELAGIGALVWVYSLSWSALGVSLSAFFSRANLARVLTIVMVTVLIAGPGLVELIVDKADAPLAFHSLRSLFVTAWGLELLEGGAVALSAMVVSVMLALFHLVPGVLRMEARDL